MNYDLRIHLLNIQVEELIKIIDSLEKNQQELVDRINELEADKDEQVSEDK
jgi:hypothetical protein